MCRIHEWICLARMLEMSFFEHAVETLNLAFPVEMRISPGTATCLKTLQMSSFCDVLVALKHVFH